MPHTTLRNSQIPAGHSTVQLSSETTSAGICQIPQGKDSVLQDGSPPHTSDISYKASGSYLYFGVTGYGLEVPATSSLSSLNLLEWFRELRETLTVPGLLKGMTKSTYQQSDEEGCRARSQRSFCPLGFFGSFMT